MLKFSQILLEARKAKRTDLAVLTADRIDDYINKVKKYLTKNVLDAIYLTKQLEIFDGTTLQSILDASKPELQKISDDLSTVHGKTVDPNLVIELQKHLQSLKSNVRLLPQMQTEAELEALMNGDLYPSDLTIDITTSAGRNAAAKLYTPVVQKIVNQYVGRSSLDRAALMSAGMLGLAEAMKDYDPEKSKMTFKSYAAYRIQQAILNDINEYSHDLSGTNWYATKKYGDKLDAVSIDSVLGGDDDDDFSQDHLSFLGASDDMRWIDLPKSEQELWNDLFKLLESKFSVKECNIFYRYFGLGEFWGKKEKSKDIAKSYGMSEGNIRNSIINKMLRYMYSDPKARRILDPIRSLYESNLMCDLIYYTDKQAIYEALISDDTFILLEELNKWNNKDVFQNTVKNALNIFSKSESGYLTNCIKNGFTYIDNTYKRNKSIITDFLNSIYPTETFDNQSDVAIINRLSELSDISKQHKIDWK